MCVEIEARYKALNALIRRHLTSRTAVVELAAGLSPRRTEFGGVPYYELDLPEIVEIKKEIYRDMNLPCDGLIRLDLCDTERLYDTVREIAGKEREREILIVSEGLFWYLKRKDIRGMLDVFRRAFSPAEWKWLTSDCFARETYEPEYRKVIAKSSNKSSTEPFADFEDERAFFSENGIALDRYRITDLIAAGDVFSGSFFSIPEDEVRARIENYTDIACLTVTP